VHDSDAFDQLALDRTAARIASECNQSPVAAACQSTVHALSRFWGLLAEGPQLSARHEVEAAKAQFDSALVAIRSEPCRSRSDCRAKILTIDLLAGLFPEDDNRIVELRRATIEDMARFFEVDVSAPLGTGRASALSRHGDSSAAE
jgi:hypothetical protein